MKYNKPRILSSDDAVLAIQFVGQSDSVKPSDNLTDSYPGTIKTTASAYQADE
jgi:hypothetical protein